jgi:hypothetical protein
MSKTPRVYSPALNRSLVRRLYFAAKDLRIPMTRLLSQIVEEALDRIAPISSLPDPQS